jgi:dTDP-4-dehydrorhamnose reductase
MTVWIVGNKGMLGRELSRVLAGRGVPFLGSDKEVDIRGIDALRGFAGGKSFAWIVNCSAYTAVDRAEDEEEAAYAINAEGAGNLARVAEEIGARIVHLSTDYVFRGDSATPCLESDPVNPGNAYGRTKAEGERLVAKACARHFILRTAWLYGKHGPNFVFTMLRLMNERETVDVVDDQHGSPTWARDLAEAIASIIEEGLDAFGLYHFTGEGGTTWYEFAREILAIGTERGVIEKDCSVRRIGSDRYPTKAKRPAWSILSLDKSKMTLGFRPKEWRESLRAFFDDAFRNLDGIRSLSLLAEYDMTSAISNLEGARWLYAILGCRLALERNLNVLAMLGESASPETDLRALAERCGIPLEDDEGGLLGDLTAFDGKFRLNRDVRGLSREFGRLRAELIVDKSRTLCDRIRKHPIFSIWKWGQPPA